MEKNNFEKYKKMQKLKTKMKQSFTKPIISDSDVLAYLVTLHQKYTIVPTAKAGNKFGFICKNLYISKFLMGEYNNIQSNFNYSKTNFVCS